MDSHREENEANFEGSWIPVTPGKPTMEMLPPICSNAEVNQLKSTLLRQEHFQFGSSSEEQASRLDACSVNGVESNGLERGEAAFSRKLEMDGGSSNNVTEQTEKIKFSDLVKLASASLLPLSSNAAEEGIKLSYTDLLQSSYWKSSPEWTISDAASGNKIPQFAPITPDKATSVHQKPFLQMQNLDYLRNEDKEKHDHDMTSTIVDDKSPEKNKELSQPESDSSVPHVCTPVEKNHNPDKEPSNPDDQKQRRRKHRPKVINEGKPKRTPKQATPNPIGSTVNRSGKRKYVRKNAMGMPSSTYPKEVTEESTNEEVLNSTKKLCRRKLKFDNEIQPGDKSSQSIYPSLDSESWTQDSPAEKIILRVETQFGSEVQEIVGNTREMKNCMNQMVHKEYKHYVRRSRTTKLDNAISTNMKETDHNAWTVNQMLNTAQFPNIKKKKRTKNGERQEMKFSQICQENPNALEEQDIIVVPESNISLAPEIARGKGLCDRIQKFEGTMPSFLNEGMKKKRTKGTKPGRCSTSLTKLVSTNFQSASSSGKIIRGDGSMKKIEDSQGAETFIHALTKPATLPRKKRTKKMKSQNATYSWAERPHQGLQTAMFTNQPCFYKTLGDWSGHLWDQMVDTVIELFDLLYINKKYRKFSHETQHALVPYDMQNQDHNALVIYKRDGTMVPVKKRRPRAKVELDEETNKVWNLLMIDMNSAGIDGTDEEKTKWWNEERRIFQGRADSFIARMHLVQGDRRFSKWKGSVLDSVVGVFLTQNVSDHLSSSAFMSLAAHFPLGSQSNKEGLHDETLYNHPSVSFSADNQSKDARDSSETVDNGNQSEVTIEVHNSSVGDSATLSSHQLQEEPVLKFLANDLFEYQIEEIQVFNVSKTESATSGTFQNLFASENMFEGMLDKTSINFESPDAQSNNKMHESSSEVVEEKTDSNSENQNFPFNIFNEMNGGNLKLKKKQVKKQQKVEIDWDRLRKQAEANGKRTEKTTNTMDSLDWEAVRSADVKDIADTIKERGMNNVLAERIKDFLNRIVKDHGSIDLEWLRDVSPDQAKEYLLSIRGLGLKSVECVRLLTLHHLAFPVDTNVGRIAVRLGWVPLQPLPESLQLHLLELYPMLESIQKYLWPRLCKLDQKTLYELHYQMITFGKVFCTKNKPNCNSCPMRGDCRHFASAFASARLALPAPEEKNIVCASGIKEENATPPARANQQLLTLPHAMEILEEKQPPESSHQPDDKVRVVNYVPIIEEPMTPEPESENILENDIEDAFHEDPDEIPTIKLNIEVFTQNLHNYMQENMELQESHLSRAIVAITPELASIPVPKLKNINRLRTEHQVYELPDSHPLLEKLNLERRQPDDPSLYLLAIWAPGETAESTQQQESGCSFQESGNLCGEKECYSCNSVREANSPMVRGTLLIPCRTAMKGSFPLNGTYFQVNEITIQALTQLTFQGLGYGTFQGELCTLEPLFPQYSEVYQRKEFNTASGEAMYVYVHLNGKRGRPVPFWADYIFRRARRNRQKLGMIITRKSPRPSPYL